MHANGGVVKHETRVKKKKGCTNTNIGKDGVRQAWSTKQQYTHIYMYIYIHIYAFTHVVILVDRINCIPRCLSHFPFLYRNMLLRNSPFFILVFRKQCSFFLFLLFLNLFPSLFMRTQPLIIVIVKKEGIKLKRWLCQGSNECYGAL